jgi:hypothetical protein
VLLHHPPILARLLYKLRRQLLLLVLLVLLRWKQRAWRGVRQWPWQRGAAKGGAAGGGAEALPGLLQWAGQG